MFGSGGKGGGEYGGAGICWGFQQGNCTWGANCRFSHEPSAKEESRKRKAQDGEGPEAKKPMLGSR